MAEEIKKLSSYAANLTVEIDNHFNSSPRYVKWRDRVNNFLNNRIGTPDKIEEVVKKYGYFLPLVLIAAIARKNPLMFITGTAVAFWASRETEKFTLLKRPVIRDAKDSFIASTILIAARVLCLRNTPFFFLTGFTTGYALFHKFSSPRSKELLVQSPPSPISTSSSQGSSAQLARIDSPSVSIHEIDQGQHVVPAALDIPASEDGSEFSHVNHPNRSTDLFLLTDH